MSDGSRSRLRILHVIGGLDVGGAETMLLRLVRGMDPSRAENHVVSLTPPAREIPRDVRLQILSARPRANNWFKTARALADAANQIQPDVIQGWMYYGNLGALMAARGAPKAKIAWNIRCTRLEWKHYPRRLRLAFRLCAWSSRRPHVIVANSWQAKRDHADHGFHDGSWTIIPNGFDLERYAPRPGAAEDLRGRLRLPSAAPLVGMFARYDPMKDHETLLSAAALLHSRHPGLHWVLAGHRVDYSNAALVRSIHTRGLDDRVVLLGERHDLETWYPGLDVFVLSSAFGEAFPNVLGEALAAGTPCVATDVGDAREIIGGAGIVVPPRDPAALAGGISKLLSAAEADRHRLRRAARDRASSAYDLRAVVHAYEAMYGDLAENVRDRRDR